ncbi:DNA/RNA helicase domain-containing protein [Nocardia gipuzkoensis]
MTRHPYRSTAGEVFTTSPSEPLSTVITEHLGRRSPPAQLKAWDDSLPLLAGVLVDAGLAMIDMLIEYPLPEASQRADVVLAGRHPETGDDNYIVVELVAWRGAALAWNSDQIVQVNGLRNERLHPVDQVRGYCHNLRQYVPLLHDRPAAMHGVAYLHNATRKSVETLFLRWQDDLGRMFTRDQRKDFIEYLQNQFAPEPGRSASDRLLASEVRRRVTPLQFAADTRRTAAALLDDQKLAYETVWSQVQLLSKSKFKGVILVTGGPGSAKSLIAVSLLAELHRFDRRVRYASGSPAIIETMRRSHGRHSRELRPLFTYYREAPTNDNSLDVLICDEAHGIRKTSANRWDKNAHKTNRPQIDELMAAARVPIFLLDEHEVIRPDQVGTVEYIMNHAARSGFPVFHTKLDGRFRLGGSAAYDEWVLRLLGIRAGGPTAWTSDDFFDVRIADSPQEMEDFLRSKENNGETARITAGYCWPWSDPRDDGTLVSDIEIGDWSKPWNKKGSKILGEFPPASLWATDPRGFAQVGTVYTVQGFEHDWAGVILGPDIVADGQRLAIRREFNCDPTLRSRRNGPVSDEDFELLIRNTYKVLLTRGMRGVVLYAVDPATHKFIAGLVGSGPRQQAEEADGVDRSTSAWAPQGSRVQMALASLSETSQQVFLCHSSGDKPAVRQLYDELRDKGFRPWLDAVDLVAGENWEFEIRKAIKSSDVVVVCLSEGSVSKRGFVQKEILFALDEADRQPEGRIYLIPARLEPCEIPSRLTHLHWVDLFEDGGHERLGAAIRLSTSQ